MNIETKRLTLFPTELKHFELILESKNYLSEHLGVNVSDTFPESKEALPWFYDLVKADETLVGWISFWALHRADNRLIGDIGFKGKPDENGKIEIGYSIISEYRKQGFATEIVEAFLKFGFSKTTVKVIEAQTKTDNIGSIKILERLAMKQIGTVEDPQDGTMFQWKLEKSDYFRGLENCA